MLSDILPTGHEIGVQYGKVKVGDVVVEVAGEKPAGLADLWRRIWRLGPSGTLVPLKVLRKSALVDIAVHSGDRNDFLKKPHLH